MLQKCGAAQMPVLLVVMKMGQLRLQAVQLLCR
jgi:hypothetical protein